MASPTPRKVSVSTIKSRLLRPALTSHYICRFSPTTKNGKLLGFLKQREGEGFIGADYQNPNNQEIIEFSCSEASLPGVNYLTNEINDDFHGVTERYAYRRSYDDRMDFTFYVDRDYRPINFLESWMSFIAGEQSRRAPVDRTYFYRVEFPDNYTTDELYITKFERDIGTPDQGPSLTYRFINAYPININTMPVSYESSQLLKCTVSFTFSRYLIEKTVGGAGTSGTSGTSPTPPGQTPAPGVPSPSIGDPNAPQSIPAVPGAPSQNEQFGTTPGFPSFGGPSLTPPSTAAGVPSASTLGQQPSALTSRALTSGAQQPAAFTVSGQQSGAFIAGGQRSGILPENIARVSNLVTPIETYNKNAGTGAIINNINTSSETSTTNNRPGGSTTNARPGGSTTNARPGAPSTNNRPGSVPSGSAAANARPGAFPGAPTPG